MAAQIAYSLITATIYLCISLLIVLILHHHIAMNHAKAILTLIVALAFNNIYAGSPNSAKEFVLTDGTFFLPLQFLLRRRRKECEKTGSISSVPLKEVGGTDHISARFRHLFDAAGSR